MTKKREATVYLIPVPLGDTAFSRVLPDYHREVVESLRYFIVENIRTARRFLKRMNPAIEIDKLHFKAMDKYIVPAEIAKMLVPLSEGESIGVMSEAGCPAVADPGAMVVAFAHRNGYRVEPLVGPSSILLALMSSGLNGQHFTFHGYLPVEAAKRADRLKVLEARMIAENETQIFIETPYRNNKLLEDIIRVCNPMTWLCIASNITCEGEQVKTRRVKEWKLDALDLHKIPTIFILGNEAIERLLI